MVKRRGVVEKNEQEKQQFVNKIKLFFWQRGLLGKAARRGGEERVGEAAVCEQNQTFSQAERTTW